MSVLKGEGKVPILFGAKSVVSGALTHETYLARPDLTGEWPTVVLVPPAWGLTSSVKDIARRLARHGVAVVAVDLHRGKAPRRATAREEAEAAFEAIPASRVQRLIDDVVDYIVNPAGFWSSAEHGFAVMGMGRGGGHAITAAAAHDAALVLAAASLEVASLAAVTGPVLGIYGREDEVVPLEVVMEARAAAPHAEWVLYERLGHDFMDDHAEGFDLEAYADAVERIAAFCEKHLERR